MKAKSQSLSEVADVIAGQSPTSDLYNSTGEGLPFYQGKTDFGAKYPTERNWCKGNGHKIAVENDILLSVRAPVSPVNICQKQSIIGRGLAAIRSKKAFSFEYIYYFLKNSENKIAKLGTGSTFKAITKTEINKLKIYLPETLDDQIRIATILTRAENLIAKRKESIKALDELLKSTFGVMFGDPVRNNKGWDVLPMNKIGKFISGGTPSKIRDDYWKGNYPWVSPKDMKVHYIFRSQDTISNKVFEETNLKKLGVGHLLIVVRGMILVHTFPTAINMVDVSINQDMKAIFPIKNVLVKYLKSCLDNMERQVLTIITTAGHGTKKFDTDAMEKIYIPIPPLFIQKQYTDIVEKVESIKSKYAQSLAELENLYGSLSQRAFKGELDVSKIPADIRVV